MTESTQETLANPPASAPSPRAHPRRSPRARPYLRLIWIIPFATLFAVGLWSYTNVAPGGTVDRILLTTKPGPVGQAAEAMRLVTGTFDIYLTIKTSQGKVRTPVKKNTAIGNGLKWGLDDSYKLDDLKQIDVFDEHTIRGDKNLDHINVDGQWQSEGQLFQIRLQGQQHSPPVWALP